MFKLKKGPTNTNLSEDFFQDCGLTVNLEPSGRIVSCGIQVSLQDLKETTYTVVQENIKQGAIKDEKRKKNAVGFSLVVELLAVVQGGRGYSLNTR